jgi:hypothetical protein
LAWRDHAIQDDRGCAKTVARQLGAEDSKSVIFSTTDMTPNRSTLQLGANDRLSAIEAKKLGLDRLTARRPHGFTGTVILLLASVIVFRVV